MKKRIIFLFLLTAQIQIAGYANSQSYYDNLLKLSKEEINNLHYAKSLEYLTEVKIHAKANKLFDTQLIVLNRMGLIYTEIMDYDRAMDCFLESYQILSEKPDKKMEITILNNISQLYFLSNDFDKVIESLSKAYSIAVELKDSSVMFVSMQNMSMISNKQGNLEQAEKYLNIAKSLLKNKPQDSYWAISIKAVEVEYLYLKKEYDLAEQLALRILNQNLGGLKQEQALELQKESEMELRIELLFILSKIYYQEKNFPKAIAFAEQSLKDNSKLQMQIEIYSHLSDLYRATNALALALRYQDAVIVLKDSLSNLNSMNLILRREIQFDLNSMEKKLMENKEKHKRNQFISLSVIFFITAVFLLLLYLRSAKNKRLKIIAALEKNEKILLEQRLKEQETVALLKQKIYLNEIELKNKQLVSKTLFQLSKNELIKEIINELSHISNHLKSAEWKSIIQKLKSQIKEPAGTDWNSFLTYFEQTNPSFLSSLKEKHPNLSASDIRLSSYIYLNLDTKEIAKLLHITPEYCKKKKQHLAQKLGLPSTQIYRYLSNVD